MKIISIIIAILFLYFIATCYSDNRVKTHYFNTEVEVISARPNKYLISYEIETSEWRFSCNSNEVVSPGTKCTARVIETFNLYDQFLFYKLDKPKHRSIDIYTFFPTRNDDHWE